MEPCGPICQDCLEGARRRESRGRERDRRRATELVCLEADRARRGRGEEDLAVLDLLAGEPTDLAADEFLHRFERRAGQRRRVQLGEHDIGRPSLVNSAKRNPLLVVQPQSDEDEFPHRGARIAGRLFSFPPKTLNRVLRNRGLCARGASSCPRSAGRKSDAGSWIWASCTSICASSGTVTDYSSRRRHGWISTFQRTSGNSARDLWPSGATKTSLRCRSRSSDRFPAPSTRLETSPS